MKDIKIETIGKVADSTKLHQLLPGARIVEPKEQITPYPGLGSVDPSTILAISYQHGSLASSFQLIKIK